MSGASKNSCCLFPPVRHIISSEHYGVDARGVTGVSMDSRSNSGEERVANESLREELRQLSRELDSAREKLRLATGEQLENARALRDAVEHIDATRNVLTSVNSELRDTRKRLVDANQELRNANLDLAVILGCIDVPIVLVGRDLLIRSFTEGASKLLHLEASDTGRSVLEVLNIREFVRSAAEGGLQTREAPVIAVGENRYVLRIQWYKAENGEERALLLLHEA